MLSLCNLRGLGSSVKLNIERFYLSYRLLNLIFLNQLWFKYRYDVTFRSKYIYNLFNVNKRLVFFSVDDHSRVVLNSPGYDGNGYIHANYIEACIK